jgi:hypothetical protein
MLHLELQILRFAKEFALVHLSKLKFSLFLNRNEFCENILMVNFPQKIFYYP